MTDKMSDKNLLDFLEELRDLTNENIKFIRKIESSKIINSYMSKYREYHKQIQDLINSFDFINTNGQEKK